MNQLRIRVGHTSCHERGTGASVFLLERPASCVYHLCGSAPATRDIAVLNLDTSVTDINALAFLGGSAFGLGAADGALRWLQERNRGLMFYGQCVPIVPAAGIYDLSTRSNSPPTAEDVYLACENAVLNNTVSGQIGAATGATIGKLVGMSQAVPGGFGSAIVHHQQKIIVQAYAVVNCLGNVVDLQGNVLAGSAPFSAVDMNVMLPPQNTTLIALFTNVKLSPQQLAMVAKMAVAGIARVVNPVFTNYDGDIVFCSSVGEEKAELVTVGTMAAEAVTQAILNSVEKT